jgi:phage terminase large subunit
LSSSILKINDKFKPLIFNTDCRYFILTGGRGSGKSFVASLNEVTKTFDSNYRCLFTRYTMSSAHISIIPEFIEKIELLGLHNSFSINKTDIQNVHTGADIIFRGIKTSAGNQTANLKSLQGVSTWVVDEAEEIDDETIFDKIDLSIRKKGIQNRVILILNPTTKEHWIYNRFFEGKGVNEGYNGIKGDVCYIHTTFKDNLNNLDQSFINNVEEIRINNAKKYQHQILGGWLEKAEGVVFTNWEIGEFNPDNLQTSFGQDYGFSIDPTTLVEVAIDKSKKIIYVKEHLYKARLTSSQIAEINLKHAERNLIVADSAEPRLITELAQKGCNVQPTIKGQGSINAGITKMQDFKIVVDPKSINIVKELNNYVYADKGSKLYVDNYNHAIDAIRYNVMFHLSGDYGIILA